MQIFERENVHPLIPVKASEGRYRFVLRLLNPATVEDPPNFNKK